MDTQPDPPYLIGPGGPAPLRPCARTARERHGPSREAHTVGTINRMRRLASSGTGTQRRSRPLAARGVEARNGGCGAGRRGSRERRRRGGGTRFCRRIEVGGGLRGPPVRHGRVKLQWRAFVLPWTKRIWFFASTCASIRQIRPESKELRLR